MLWSSSFISGWRATDSISLPKMNPMPIPAPIEPSPAPMPRAIALPAALTPVSVTVVVAAVIRSICSAPCLVALGDSSTEVDRGQGREDKRLQGGDEAHLEDVEG